MKAKEIMAIIVVVMCCLFFWPMTANAKLVTIEIEAVVDSVDDDHGVLEGKIKTGDIITGWYSYDTSTPDSNPSISEGRYLHYTPPYGIFLSVGGFNFETDPANVDFLVEITNDYPPNDGYFLLSYSNIPLSSDVVVDYIFWHLYDPMGSALSTDALPTTPPVLDEWQFNHLLITGPSLGKSFGIEGHVISAIPGAFCGDPNHPYPVGDLNQDCRVDLLDLAILASHWLEDRSPGSAQIVTVKFPLAAEGRYDPNSPGWQTDFDLGVRFIEISHVYMDWSGEITAGLAIDPMMPGPQPFPCDVGLIAYLGRNPGARHATVYGGEETYPDPESFDSRIEFELLGSTTWSDLLDGQGTIKIGYVVLGGPYLYYVEFGFVDLSRATLVAVGTPETTCFGLSE
jgi:hypothetical protein